MNRTTSLLVHPPRKFTNLQIASVLCVCSLVLILLVLPGIGISLCLSVTLLLAWLYACWKFPFPALCCVAVIGMCQGIVKQVFNWSQIVYVGLDLPWVLFIGVWLVRRLKTKHNTTFGATDALMLLFFAWSAVELFNPNLPSKFMAIGALRNRLMPMLFFWVGKDLLNIQRSRRLLMVCLLIAGIGGILGICEWTLGGAEVAKFGPGFVPHTSLAWRDDTGQGHLRPLSIYQDAGLAAMFSTSMFCVALNMWDKVARKQKLFVIISGLLCAAFVSVSGVRGAILCGFIGLLITMAMDYKKALPVVMIVGLLILALSFLGGSHLSERYQTLSNPLQAYQTNRGQTVTATTQLIQDTPLGLGTGSATSSADTYVTLLDPGTKVQVHTDDNAFAVLVAEGGIPLAILYSCLLGIVFYTAWKARSSTRDVKILAPIMVVFCTILFVFSFTNMVIDWQPTNILFWMLTGSLVACAAPEIRSAFPAGNIRKQLDPAREN